MLTRHILVKAIYNKDIVGHEGRISVDWDGFRGYQVPTSIEELNIVFDQSYIDVEFYFRTFGRRISGAVNRSQNLGKP
jgi:hypothetical protein